MASNPFTMLGGSSQKKLLPIDLPWKSGSLALVQSIRTVTQLSKRLSILYEAMQMPASVFNVLQVQMVS